ncbi:MYB DNA-binding domain-containing protein [Cordyceps javanica]|uniref:MYB DNA-binding domain-containing protein n=1 Tax=Cordyceps javanica TaxID=43265 RepID=A0A545UVJ6_9HYPO|nr:MYB DNA-binding domain-containing protein [Cordyceps javanica]TQW05170.1 MYB DNA-binding domain protein [Cordyceps javanica]
MASQLPAIPRVTFTIIEPISLVAGFIGAIRDPTWFIAEQLPEKQLFPASEHSIVMAQQLGNMYLLMCFIGLAVLTTTSEIKVVRSYLIALWLGDIGHLAFTCLALGKERVMQPQAWNAMTWGNIGFTIRRSGDQWALEVFLNRRGSFTEILLIDSDDNPLVWFWFAPPGSRNPYPSQQSAQVRVPRRPQSVDLGFSSLTSSPPALPAPKLLLAMRSKRKVAPASTAPEPMPTRRTRGRPRRSEPAAVADEPDRGMATRTRAAILTSPTLSTAVIDRSSLIKDPVARKGPPRGSIHSELSIPSDPPRNEEDDDDNEADDNMETDHGAGAVGDGQADNTSHHNEGPDASEHMAGVMVQVQNTTVPAQQQDDTVQVQDDDVEFMRHHIVQLANTAKRILEYYWTFDVTDKVARRSFELEMDTFGALRRHFMVDEKYAPFLQWTWLRDHANMAEAEVIAFKTALLLANLATLFEIIYYGAKNGQKYSSSSDAEFLGILDENLQDLLLGGNQVPPTESIVNLALDIRAARLVAKLANAKVNRDARTMAYNVFCVAIVDIDQMDHALQNGPYMPVAGLEGGEVDHRCRTCLSKFLKHIGSPESNFSNLALFRNKLFPAEDLLLAIQATYRELEQSTHDSSRTQNNPQDPAEAAEEFHDAATELSLDDPFADDDAASQDSESQPIVRLPETQAGAALFQDASDLQALEATRPTAPPSNQHAGTSRGSTLPVNHDAAPLTPYAARRSRHVGPSPASPQLGRKRTRHEAGPATAYTNDDDGAQDGDDYFETDKRRMSEAARRQKRQRLEAETQARVARHLLQHHQYHQQQQTVPGSSPRPSAPLSTSATSVGAASTRRPLRPAVDGKQRHPWSDHDSGVLVALVAKHYGKWSLIQNDDEDNHLFEHPRDQQAYRDRARNMKVDLLISDRRLPQGFDFVALGTKERRRVEKFGKNPERKERDVDMRTGEVTNTEFVPGLHRA